MTIGKLNQLKLNMDMTEITGLDDMHHPEDIILESMSQFSKHEDYDAFLLVNGTTSGILAVIQAFSSEKGRYLISRNVHNRLSWSGFNESACYIYSYDSKSFNKPICRACHRWSG